MLFLAFTFSLFGLEHYYLRMKGNRKLQRHGEVHSAFNQAAAKSDDYFHPILKRFRKSGSD